MIHITRGLGVYWTSPSQAQIGIDPRIGVRLTNLTKDELRLIDRLTSAHTITEYLEAARSLNITPTRAQEISALLETAGVLSSDLDHIPDAEPHWRIFHTTPTVREQCVVTIPALDQLGFEVARELVAAGVGTVVTGDRRIVGEQDHPDLARDFLGVPRADAFISIARDLNPRVRLNTQEPPHLVILTSHHGINPYATRDLLARGIPTLHAWVEEIDLFVGPLTVPHVTPCPTCLHLQRVDRQPDWELIAPQALSAKEIVPPISSLKIASALCAADALAFCDAVQPATATHLWKIPPAPALPERIELDFHPNCGCRDDQFFPTQSSPR